MSIRGRSSNAQTKAIALAMQRRKYGLDRDALARPDECNTWSAMMPAYYGTELQAKHGGRCNGE